MSEYYSYYKHRKHSRRHYWTKLHSRTRGLRLRIINMRFKDIFQDLEGSIRSALSAQGGISVAKKQ